MRIAKLSWQSDIGWQTEAPCADADLLLYFGSREILSPIGWFEDLQRLVPNAHILGCSTCSHIVDHEIAEEGIAAVAISFASASIRAVAVPIDDATQSAACGVEIGAHLAAPDLAGIIVLSDGLVVNGTALTHGIASQLPPGTPVTGGLAADGSKFLVTMVGLDGPPRSGKIAAVGIYGDGVRFNTGSAGGWAEFGPRRRITRSTGNVLMALDDRPALDLYERYLGEEDAQALPSSGLLFPLKVFDPQRPEHSVVRTILAVDRTTRSMTFAGDVPQGWVAQLMRGDIDRLSLGAAEAARQITRNGPVPSNALILMVSCIGRRLLMGQRTIDEIDAVTAEIAQSTALGFYSYGEICPHPVSGLGEMHNQTMTITAISEAA
jgi:hypothetical protein